MDLCSPLQHLFPNGKSKALVMSYDDGSEHDRQLVDLFNRYGIRGTFHLNSAKLGQPHHVSQQEVKSLYEGHEVSSHAANHPYLTQLSDDQITQEILEDRKLLEELTDTPVRGFAYPFGDYNDRVVTRLSALDTEYARTTDVIQPFQVPTDFLRWRTTCHHSRALEMGNLFLESKGNELELMQIWGHSYELDGFMTHDMSKDWRFMEEFCELVGGHDFICYATMIEIVQYLKALRMLQFSAAEVSLKNASKLTLWVRWDQATLEIGPGSTLALEN